MRILFQGDSITDACRSRENDIDFGRGYPLLVKASLGYKEPEKYEFFNRGEGGNRIAHIYARIKRDILNIKPDFMSILVGVNDVWHEFSYGTGTDNEKYFMIYDMLISEIKESLPNIKIMIMEPFILKGSATEENWLQFRQEVEKRAAMAKKISEKYELPFLELQKGFDELSENIGSNYWLVDGVHPTPMGHEYIKQEWLKIFNSL